MRLLIAGAPGAGKGTHGAVLSYQLDVPHVASGELIREHIAAGTEAGRLAGAAVARGDLVPDATVVQMLRPTLAQAARAGGYVLDGFPRTRAQAELVADVTADVGGAVHVALHLDVPEKQVVERLVARGRDDDTADVVRHRLDVYREQTLPMLAFYVERHQLVVIDGTGSVEQVNREILRGLQEWRLRQRFAHRATPVAAADAS
jgi:adenylate kinase